MHKIWQCELNFNLYQQVHFFPAGSVPICAQLSKDFVKVWVKVDPNKPTKSMAFTLFWTGQDIPDELVYIGTVQHPISGLVWHVYYEKE